MKTHAIEKIGILGAVLAATLFLLTANVCAFVPPETKIKEGPKGKQEKERRIELKKDALGMPIIAGGPAGLARPGKPEYQPGVIMVKFKEGATPQKVIFKSKIKANIIKRVYEIAPAIARNIQKDSKGRFMFKGKSYGSLKDIDPEVAFASIYPNMPDYEKRLYRTYKITLGGGLSVAAAIVQLKKDSDVEYAEPNLLVKAQMVPNDPLYPQQWAHQNMQSEPAWDLSTGGSDVVIAISDTGIDYNHEDLAANMWHNPGEIPGNGIDDDSNGYIDDYYGYDFCNNDADPIDDYGHGTHCAGIAGAVINNGIGVAGICPTAKIMAIKFLSAEGSGYEDAGANSIIYAADNGAKVISCSWGGSGTSSLIQDAVNYAYSMGCFIAASAGNSEWDTNYFCPANCLNVFTVAAIQNDNSKVSFSNFGSKVDVAAPGVDVLSTMPQYHVTMNDWGYKQNYSNASGTSMACPQVAGEAALLFSRYPSHTPAKVANIIRAGALASIISNEYVGTGRINLYESWLKNNDLPDPTAAKITAPSYNKLKGGENISLLGTAGASNYSLSYAATPYAAGWTEFAQGHDSVNNGLLGYFNTSGMANGMYFIKLTATTNAWSPAQSNTTKIFFDHDLLPGWPPDIEFPETMPSIVMSPVCADFDNDGQKELFVINMKGGKAYLFRPDGTLMPGWPKTVPQDAWFINTPAVTDLDNDGDLEIVLPAIEGTDPRPYFGFNSPVIYVWHHDLTNFNGFPKVIQPPAGANIFSSLIYGAAVGDINGDGQLEIVFTLMWSEDIESDDNYDYKTIEVYAFDKNGNKIKGWPLRYSHVFVKTDVISGAYAVSNPALADINNDGAQDIIFAYASSTDCIVNVVDGRTRAPLYGWPRIFPGNSFAPVAFAVGDVNNDGCFEIFFGNSQKKVYGLTKDGFLLDGWPRGTSADIISGIALADINSDNFLEIILQDTNRRYFVFSYQGLNMPGWPQLGEVYAIGSYYSYPTEFASSPVVGDIEGDGIQDIIQGTNNSFYGKVDSFDALGNIKPGFPKDLHWIFDRVRSTASLDDLDGDGRTELIFADNFFGNVYIYRYGTFNSQNMKWPMLGQNLRRTYSLPLVPLPPAPPVITSIDPAAAPVNTTVNIIGSGSGFGSTQGSGTVKFGTTNAVIRSWSPLLVSCDVPNIPPGICQVTVTTSSGAAPNAEFVVVGVPRWPGISRLTPDSGYPNTPISIAGYNFGSSRGLIKFGDTEMTVNSWSDTSIACTAPADLSAGVYPVKVWNAYGDGIPRTSNAVNFTVPSPRISTLAPFEGGPEADLTITGTGFGSTQGSGTVRFGGNAATVKSWSNKSIVVKVPYFDPGFYFVAVATQTGQSNRLSFLIPEPRIISIAPVSGSAASDAVISGNYFGNTPGTNRMVSFDWVPAAINSWSDTSISVKVPHLASGTRWARVFIDPYNMSNAVSFTIPAPQITGLVLVSGSPSSSSKGNVTINGSGFGHTQGPGTVKFGDTAVVIKSWSNTSIGVVVPGILAETYTVTVAASAGTVQGSFTLGLKPSITKLKPASGRANSIITIYGSNFGAAQGSGTVKFDATAAVVTNWSGTSISCIVPAIAGGQTYPVTVTVAGRVSNSENFRVTR